MSEPFDAKTAAGWMGADTVRGEETVRFDAVSIDSRQIGPGSLFFAIRGERHDAHRFLPDVIEAGAAGVVVERAHADLETGARPTVVLVVDDTTLALGRLAKGHRGRFEGPVVAITGSNGKTTTKELTASVLGQRFDTLKTSGNLNNQFGLPLTLLQREAHHQALVVEMGMNHRGEIAALAAIGQPTVGVLNNVGTAHIEYLGSREAIAEEKGDLTASLPASGTAVIHRDDPLAFAQRERVAGRVLGFGRSADADLRASDVGFLPEGRFAFQLTTPLGEAMVTVAGLSETMVENALAAAGAGIAVGLSLEEVVRGLEAFEGVPGRMAPRHTPQGLHIVDDTYNANPQSMREGLIALSRLRGDGARGIAVVGDMGELGAEAASAHRETGRLAAELELDLLVAVGERAETVIEGAREAGMEADRLAVEADPETAAERVLKFSRPGDWVLVKGSRAARMERAVEALVNRESG